MIPINGNGFFKRYFYTQALMLYSKKGEGFGDTMFQTMPAALFFMLPIFAMLLYLFHRKIGPFSHHLVFSFYYFTFAFCVLAVLVIFSAITEIPDLITFLVLCLLFVHLVLGVANFYGQRKRTSFWKSSLIVFIFNMIVIPVTFIIALVVSFFLY